MNEKERSDADQNITFLIDYLPSLWRGIYNNLISQGFKEHEALVILKAYIQRPNG